MTDDRTPGTLEDLRAEIERLDGLIVDALARRVAVARHIGALKRERGDAVLDPGREAGVVRRAAARARERGLPEEEVRQIFWQIVGMARRSQIEPGGEE